MRRFLASVAALSLLCAAVGCHTAGVCDCDGPHGLVSAAPMDDHMEYSAPAMASSTHQAGRLVPMAEETVPAGYVP